MGICSCIKQKGQTQAEQKQVIQFVLDSEQMNTSAKLRVIRYQTDITYQIIIERFYQPSGKQNEQENDIVRKILLDLCQIRKKLKKIPPKTEQSIKNILFDNMNMLLLDVYRGLQMYEKQETVIFSKDYFRQRNKKLMKTFSIADVDNRNADSQLDQLLNFMGLFENALNSQITKNEALFTQEVQSSLNIPIIFSIYD